MEYSQFAKVPREEAAKIPVDTFAELPYKGTLEAGTGAKRIVRALPQAAPELGYIGRQVGRAVIPEVVPPSQGPAPITPQTHEAVKQVARGTSEVISGATKATAPILLPMGLIAGPAETVATVAASTLAREGARRGLEAAGVSPEIAGLGGDVVGLTVAGGGARYLVGKFDAAVEAHNATAARLLAQEQAAGRQATTMDDIFSGDSHPITVNGKNATLEYMGASTQKGRPGFRVVSDEDGKVLYAGTGRAVQDWLRTMGAKPKAPEQAPQPLTPPATPPEQPAAVAPAPAQKAPELPPGVSVEAPPPPPGFEPIEPKPAAPAPAAPAEIAKGQTFTTADGEYRIIAAGKKQIVFQKKTDSGVVSGQMARDAFEQMVKGQQQPATVEAPAPATAEVAQTPVPPAAVQPAQAAPTETPPAPSAAPAAVAEPVAPATAEAPSMLPVPAPEAPAPALQPESPTTEAAKPEEKKEPEKHEFSSTQFNMPEEVADKVRAVGLKIRDEDLGEDGRESEPHVTVKYGLHGEDSKEVQKLLENEGPITATIGKASVFPPSEKGGPAVIKLDVDSPDLHRLNGKISTLKHTDTHPEYKPHITVAYVKPEAVDRYLFNGGPAEIEGLTGQKITLDRLTFSKKNGKTTEIELKGKPTPQTPEDKIKANEQRIKELQEQMAAGKKPEATPAPEAPQQATEAPISPAEAEIKSGDVVVFGDHPATTQRGHITAIYPHGQYEVRTDAGQMVNIRHGQIRKVNGVSISDVTQEQKPAESAPPKVPAKSVETANTLMATTAEKILQEIKYGDRALEHTRSNSYIHANRIEPRLEAAESYLRLESSDEAKTELQKAIENGRKWLDKYNASRQSGSYIGRIVDAQERHYASRYEKSVLGQSPRPADTHGNGDDAMWPDLTEAKMREVRQTIDKFFGREPEPEPFTPTEMPEKAELRKLQQLFPEGMDVEYTGPGGKKFTGKVVRIESHGSFGGGASHTVRVTKGRTSVEVYPHQVRPLGLKKPPVAPAAETTPAQQPSEQGPPASQSFKVVMNDHGNWISNGQRWATEEEAQKAGSELSSRWMGMGEWKVEPSDEPVNWRWDDSKGQGIRIEAPALLRTTTDPAARAKEIWDAMTPSERKGVSMGLFPADIMRAAGGDGIDTHALSVELLKLAEQSKAPAPTPAAAEPQPVSELELSVRAQTLSDAILKKLKAGEPIGDNAAFQKLADQAFGGSRAQGKYELKQAYDALEAAINRYIADWIGPDLLSADPFFSLEQLRNLLAKLPTQNVRSEQQQLLQQFSTPPTEAFLVAKLASIRAADTVLEPSAGTGGLLAWAKAAGATVRGNEIDPFRRTLLEYAVRGSQPTGVDAEYLNATLPAEVKPTVVIMNPPFSSTGGRVKANKNKFGYKHVLEALRRLEPGGRLVAILGEGATLKAPTAADFWNTIPKYGVLRANIGISGKEYAKYGTTFGNRIIVIDKVPLVDLVEQTGKPVELIQGDFETLEKAYAALQSLIGDRPSAGTFGRPQPSGEIVAPGPRDLQPAGGREPATAGSPSGGTGVAAPRPAPEPAPETGPAPWPGTPARQESQPEPTEPSAAETSGSSAGLPGGAGQAGITEPSSPTVPQEDRLALEARKQEDLQSRVEDDSSYVEYVPSINGLPHPGRLVETKVMASVTGPPITYNPALPPLEVLATAKKPLSAAQVEVVARAGMMHQIVDEAGFRQGFLVGDGTGVGKGQELAAIIWDRFRQGQKRALWVSGSKLLQQAAEGDFRDMGAPELAEKLQSINDYNPTMDITLPEGVIFTTYQSLIAKAKGEKGRTRLDQIEKWLGDDGVIIFDEGHKAKNAVGGTGNRAAPPSQTGQAVIKLQEDLPKAYVTYASATAATEVVNLAYMTRLGLWGEGTPFHQGFGHFLTEVGRGGVAAMEMIAREMKAMGKYLSRTISYKGVTFDETTHELTPEQRQTYDSAAEAWQLVYEMAQQQLRDNAEGGNVNGRERGNFASAYWGEQQRFFRKLLTAIKIPTLLDIVDQGLAEDKSVIISLIGTGQAQADAALAAGEDEDDLDFSPKDALIRMIQQNFPTILYEEYTDESGNVRSRPVVRDGKIQTNPEAEAKRDALVQRLNRELALPDNPLDFIIRHYGRDKVAEMTGRRKTVERNSRTGKWEPVSRAPEGVAMSKVNDYEMNAFQEGAKRIAIISKAAGTGISLQAELARKNQQKRLQIALELSWSADEQMQTFGRSHRANQAQPPEYIILSTDAGGEKRFSSTIARRLESLGALTKGQRDASGGSSVLAKYNFETLQGEQATSTFYEDMLAGRQLLGIEVDPQDILRQMGILKQQTDAEGNPRGAPYVDRQDQTNVTRALNRVLNLKLGPKEKPGPHNAVYEHYVEIFDNAVRQAVEDGTLDTGVNLVRGDGIRLAESRPIATDPKSGAQTFHYVVDVERKNKPVPVEVVRDLAGKGRGRMYKRREFRGADQPDQIIWAMPSTTPITTRGGAVERAFNYFGPAHREGKEYQRIAQSDLNQAYEPVEGADAIDSLKYAREQHNKNEKYLKQAKEREDKWGIDYYGKQVKENEKEIKDLTAQIEKAKKEQWDLWQQAHDAAPSARTEKIHMIGGSVMRVWQHLNVGQGKMDIRMAYPDEGGSVTGVVMTEGDANRVEASLTGKKVNRKTGSIFDAAVNGKEVFRLTGGIRLQQGRVNREPVIQVVTSDYNVQRFLKDIGVQAEQVGWQWKYYIPNEPATGVPILEKLLKQYPLSEEGGGQNGPVITTSIDVPPMKNRSDSFIVGANRRTHGLIARLEPLPLPKEEAAHADAYLANPSAIELLTRVVQPSDPPDRAGQLVGGLNIAPRNMRNAVAKMQAAHARIGKPEGSRQLVQVLEQAERAGKSLVLVKDHERRSDGARSRALAEELNHAAQSRIGGGATAAAHMGPPTREEFMGRELAQTAQAALQSRGYGHAQPGEMAAEIGVRLMAPGRFEELGINYDQARALASRYLRALKGEYGSKATREIASRVFTALRRGTEGSGRESSPLPGRPGPEGRGGPGGRTGPDISRNIEEPDRSLYSGRRAGKNGPGDSGAGLLRRFLGEDTGASNVGPQLRRLKDWAVAKFGEEAPNLNYSGLGAKETKYIRNLGQTSKAVPELVAPALRAASPKSQAGVIIATSHPLMRNVLAKSDLTLNDFYTWLVHDRLRGLERRWRSFAAEAVSMSDEDLEQAAVDEYYLGLLKAIEGKRDMAENIAEVATAIAQARDWDLLRATLDTVFSDAADQVPHLMTPDQWNELDADPNIQEALRIYKDRIEQPMRDDHVMNEGVLSDALGKTDTYVPLIPISEDVKGGYGKSYPYRKPKNAFNKFATGLGEQYSTAPGDMRPRLMAGIRTNTKAALVQAAEDSKLFQNVRHLADRNTITWQGVDYKASRPFVVSDARTIIQNGKVVHVPAKQIVMPLWFEREMAPILEGERWDPDGVSRWIKVLMKFTLSGPAEAAFHWANITGAIVANTPFLQDSLLGKAMSLPIIKRFAAIGYTLAVDPTTDEAARELVEMAQAGAVPSRFATETYSKRYAEELGAKRRLITLAPALFGPEGFDIRARLLMWRLAKQIHPGATPKELNLFVNQLGNYIPQLQGELERSLKRTGYSPFYTAGSTMLRNGINAWTTRGPVPGGNTAAMFGWKLLTGALGLLATWVLLHKTLVGKFPWEDPRAKFLALPVGGPNGMLNETVRRSKVGRAMWGDGPETGYIGVQFFNPLVARGARAMGISGAFNTKMRHGSPGQVFEAAQRDVLNSMIHPVAGPPFRAAAVLGLGIEPQVSDFRDRRGRIAPQFFSAIPPNAKPGLPTLGHKVVDLLSLNAFYNNLGEATGLTSNPYRKGSLAWRTVTDMAAPGLFGNASNPFRAESALHQQRTGTR